ncbi:hypothetical protein DBR17_12375 [Sphingomonas sp. HMWF008]|nr:hypothetical protein DBR17_12375 [Sphingomonas sp. HMWF008]
MAAAIAPPAIVTPGPTNAAAATQAYGPISIGAPVSAKPGSAASWLAVQRYAFWLTMQFRRRITGATL